MLHIKRPHHPLPPGAAAEAAAEAPASMTERIVPTHLRIYQPAPVRHGDKGVLVKDW